MCSLKPLAQKAVTSCVDGGTHLPTGSLLPRGGFCCKGTTNFCSSAVLAH